MTVIFDERTKHEFERGKDGHIYIDVHIVCEGSSDNDTIRFIYDTGAFITVLNRDRYEHFKLFKIPRHGVTMFGYAGGTTGYLYKIPGIKIGGKLIKGVWAFTPETPLIKQNLLGNNVLEYFRPFQDNMFDSIYFPENLTPKPFVSDKYHVSLACDGVFPIGKEVPEEV
jgi:predicted aspartyl protease